MDRDIKNILVAANTLQRDVDFLKSAVEDLVKATPKPSSKQQLQQELKALENLKRAAIIWAMCPLEGSYKDGPSVEETCEELSGAVLELLRKDINLESPPLEWWTLEEMWAKVSKDGP